MVSSDQATVDPGAGARIGAGCNACCWCRRLSRGESPKVRAGAVSGVGKVRACTDNMCKATLGVAA